MVFEGGNRTSIEETSQTKQSITGLGLRRGGETDSYHTTQSEELGSHISQEKRDNLNV